MSSIGSEQETVTLKGGMYSIVFVPQKGMNFISLKKGEIEIIDQSTRPLFEQRYAGLGALIGPHFHHRKVIFPLREAALFPHIAHVKSIEPFSHGIARYAPWKVEQVAENQIKAVVRGEDKWNSVSLKELEGQDFVMTYAAVATPEGIEINLSVRSETDSVVGLHTYYALVEGKGVIMARVRDRYNDQGTLKPIPSTWNYQNDHTLFYPLTGDTDFGFRPYPDILQGMMELKTGSYRVQVRYGCDNEENSIQLWHPAGASFVCIEPLSAQDPRKPRLTVSQLRIWISVI